MKTKEQLVKTTLSSERGFKLAVIDLLADIRNSIILAILSENVTDVFHPGLYDKAFREMKRLLTEEAENK